MSNVWGTDNVIVYNFIVYDDQQESAVQPPYKAARDQILSAYGGEVLEGTAQLVPAAELDAQGRYRRVAVAWGEDLQ